MNSKGSQAGRGGPHSELSGALTALSAEEMALMPCWSHLRHHLVQGRPRPWALHESRLLAPAIAPLPALLLRSLAPVAASAAAAAAAAATPPSLATAPTTSPPAARQHHHRPVPARPAR